MFKINDSISHSTNLAYFLLKASTEVRSSAMPKSLQVLSETYE